MSRQRNMNQADELLQMASGEELLVLAAMSNARMRRQIHHELDRRALTARVLRHAARQPMRLRVAA